MNGGNAHVLRVAWSLDLCFEYLTVNSTFVMLRVEIEMMATGTRGWFPEGPGPMAIQPPNEAPETHYITQDKPHSVGGAVKKRGTAGETPHMLVQPRRPRGLLE